MSSKCSFNVQKLTFILYVEYVNGKMKYIYCKFQMNYVVVYIYQKQTEKINPELEFECLCACFLCKKCTNHWFDKICY